MRLKEWFYTPAPNCSPLPSPEPSTEPSVGLVVFSMSSSGVVLVSSTSFPGVVSQTPAVLLKTWLAVEGTSDGVVGAISVVVDRTIVESLTVGKAGLTDMVDNFSVVLVDGNSVVLVINASSVDDGTVTVSMADAFAANTVVVGSLVVTPAVVIGANTVVVDGFSIVVEIPVVVDRAGITAFVDGGSIVVDAVVVVDGEGNSVVDDGGSVVVEAIVLVIGFGHHDRSPSGA